MPATQLMESAAATAAESHRESPVEGEPKIHVVVCGDRGHGKSTLIGRLLFNSGRIAPETLLEYERESNRIGQAGSHLAWLLDTTERERRQGFTADIRFRELHAPTHSIWVIDTPGHEDHIDRVATGLSEADAAVLVVAADQGPTGRTEELAILARTVGIDTLIVVVTKMDVVAFDKDRYGQIERQLRSLLLEIGFADSHLTFTPASALFGDNVSHGSDRLDWFDGPTVITALDRLPSPSHLTSLPFRLPIDTVYYKRGVGTIVCGKIATGKVRAGDGIVIEPGHAFGTIRSIQEEHQDFQECQAGDNVGVLLSDIDSSQVAIGYVMGPRTSPPARPERFTALVSVLHFPVRIYPGQTFTMLAHAARVPVTVEQILERTSPDAASSPDFLHARDTGYIILRPHRAVVIESQDSVPLLSRFVLRDDWRTIAAGVRVTSTLR